MAALHHTAVDFIRPFGTMATLHDFVNALVPDEPIFITGISPVHMHFQSMVELLMLGDYEQHLTAITKGSSSAIHAVSPLACTEPMCEPSFPCGDCMFAQQYVLRVYHTKNTTDSHAEGERCRPTTAMIKHSTTDMAQGCTSCTMIVQCRVANQLLHG